MTSPSHSNLPSFAELLAALAADDPSVRLRAAMMAGTNPDERLLGPLIDRCGVEPDFYVRDMLTWALIQLPRAVTVPSLKGELESEFAQARSQALHTMSKIVVPEAWPWIFPGLLQDEDDEVARAAWRVAVGIVPRGSETALLDALLGQLGRGDLEVKRSLARALVDLAVICEQVEPILTQAARIRSPEAAAHAHAVLRLVRDPGASFPVLLEQARRRVLRAPPD